MNTHKQKQKFWESIKRALKRFFIGDIFDSTYERAAGTIASHHNAAIADEREKLEFDAALAKVKELAAEWNERCEVCNSELSQCGAQGIDGEPSLDCLVCKLREQLAAERKHSKFCSKMANERLEETVRLRQQLGFERRELEEQLAAEWGRSDILRHETYDLNELIKTLVEALERIMDTDGNLGDVMQTIADHALAKVKK